MLAWARSRANTATHHRLCSQETGHRSSLADRTRTAVGLPSPARPGRWVVKAAPGTRAVTALKAVHIDIRHHTTPFSSATNLLDRCPIGHSHQAPPTPSLGLGNGYRKGIGQEPDRFRARHDGTDSDRLRDRRARTPASDDFPALPTFALAALPPKGDQRDPPAQSSFAAKVSGETGGVPRCGVSCSEVRQRVGEQRSCLRVSSRAVARSVCCFSAPRSGADSADVGGQW